MLMSTANRERFYIINFYTDEAKVRTAVASVPPQGHGFVDSLVMDKDEKIREPYEPDDTPTPPQIIEPNSGRQRENPAEGNDKSEGKPVNPTKKQGEKEHLLSEDADLNDETTI